MPKLPAISGNELVSILEGQGFCVLRCKGSHVRMASADGRFVTIPVHGSRDLPKGLLRAIIREDLDISVDQFLLWIK